MLSWQPSKSLFLVMRKKQTTNCLKPIRTWLLHYKKWKKNIEYLRKNTIGLEILRKFLKIVTLWNVRSVQNSSLRPLLLNMLINAVKIWNKSDLNAVKWLQRRIRRIYTSQSVKMQLRSQKIVKNLTPSTLFSLTRDSTPSGWYISAIKNLQNCSR